MQVPKKVLVVHAIWDDEAKVWVATSDDVPGLATEGEGMDTLVEKLKVMIPELLDANGYPDADEVPFEIHGQLAAVTYRHAA